MHIQIISLAFLILISCTNAMAGSNPAVINALQTIVKEKFVIYGEATGDLNNDGIDDWLGIVVTEKPDDSFAQIYVLIQKNGFHLAKKSKEVPFVDCAGHCAPEIIPPKNGIFCIHQSTSYGSSSSAATTKFKLYKNQWRAIGQSTVNVNFDNDSSDMSDENFLTGAYISTHSSTDVNGRVKNIKKSIIKKPTFLLLEDFDLGAF